MPRLLELEGAIRYGWNYDAYGRRPEKDEGKGGDYAINLDLVDSCIGSEFFWSMLLAFSEIAEWLGEFMVRVDSCMCHADLLSAHRHDDAPHMRELQKTWARCPMRGMMGPWFAAGQAFDLLSSLGDARVASCQVLLSPQLSVEDRQEVLSEFIRAKTHIIACVTLKHSYWTQPPYCVLGVGHPEKAVARACWEKCVSCDCDHPRLVRLRCKPMVLQAQSYFDGEAYDDDINEFLTFCSEMRLTWTAERAVEGDHTKFHKRGRMTPNHSVAFLSFARRSSELSQMLNARPQLLHELAEYMEAHKTTTGMVYALGLKDHDVVKEVRRARKDTGRNKMLPALPFLADPYSLYDMPAPMLTVKEEFCGSRKIAFDAQVLDVDGMVHKYAVAHAFSGDAGVHSEGDILWSVPVHPDAVHRLRDLLSGSFRSGDCRPLLLDMLTLGSLPGGVPDDLKSHLFFKKHSGMDGNVRNRISGEGGLLSSDISIAICRPVQYDGEPEPLVWVDMNPANDKLNIESYALVLDPHALPLSSLKDMQCWRVRTGELRAGVCMEHFHDDGGNSGLADKKERFVGDALTQMISETSLYNRFLKSSLCARRFCGVWRLRRLEAW